MTFDDFRKEYTDAFKRMMDYSPDQAGAGFYAEKMADLAEAHPRWAEIVENTGWGVHN